MKNFLKQNWFKLFVSCFMVVVFLYLVGEQEVKKTNLQTELVSSTTVSSATHSTDKIIYTNPVKENNAVKLAECIDSANFEYNRLFNGLVELVNNGELEQKYFAPSVDSLEIKKEEQKQDCLLKFK